MDDTNPFTLFLILILLILAFHPTSENELEKITNALDTMQETTTHFRTGLVKMQSILS